MSRIFSLLAFLILFASSNLFSQAGSLNGRYGNQTYPAFTGTTQPCQGLIQEFRDMETGVPPSWMVVDGDGNSPQPSTGLGKGWQGMTDPSDSNNSILASPSWYLPKGQSNDWLIFGPVALGTNPCLSWRAWSLDISFPETFEIRVASQPDTSAFLANPITYTDTLDSLFNGYTSVSLASDALSSVYIAFRQTTDDGFMMALDDVKLTNANTIDVGIFDIDSTVCEVFGKTTFTGKLINYGSDTIHTVDIFWQDLGSASVKTSLSALDLCPNSSIDITFSGDWSPQSIGNYDVCFWTENPNGTTDLDPTNDSLCKKYDVTTFVGNDPELFDLSNDGLKIYPNPVKEVLKYRSSFRLNGIIEILDQLGRVNHKEAVYDRRGQFDVKRLGSGIYFFKYIGLDSEVITLKFIKE